jgi:hypothetical protein
MTTTYVGRIGNGERTGGVSIVRIQLAPETQGDKPMSTQREVVVLDGCRTAIGDYGGALKDVPPTDLAVFERLA